MVSRYPGNLGLGMPLGASTVKNEPSSYVTCTRVTVARFLLNAHRGKSHTCPSTGTVGVLSCTGGRPKLSRIWRRTSAGVARVVALSKGFTGMMLALLEDKTPQPLRHQEPNDPRR